MNDSGKRRISGGCVCGSIRFLATALPLRITVCHCSWCQKRTGSAFGVEAVFRREDVTITGTPMNRHVHRSDESGRWLEQKFCSDCGSNIGLTLEAVPGIQSIASGAFDDPSLLETGELVVRHVFTGSARSWCDIPAAAARFERHFRE